MIRCLTVRRAADRSMLPAFTGIAVSITLERRGSRSIAKLAVNSASPTLSVVIVTLDEGENLRRTVESLWPTLPANHELIVVDDGTTDGSSDFLAGDRRVRCAPGRRPEKPRSFRFQASAGMRPRK